MKEERKNEERKRKEGNGGEWGRKNPRGQLDRIFSFFLFSSAVEAK